MAVYKRLTVSGTYSITVLHGFGFARQAMVAPVTIKWDEKSVAEGGR